MKFPHPFLWAAAIENHSKQQNRDFRPDRTPKPLKFMWGNFYIQKYPTIIAHSLIFRPDSNRPRLIPLPDPDRPRLIPLVKEVKSPRQACCPRRFSFYIKMKRISQSDIRILPFSFAASGVHRRISPAPVLPARSELPRLRISVLPTRFRHPRLLALVLKNRPAPSPGPAPAPAALHCCYSSDLFTASGMS
jgi:hypothetical protein